MTAILRNVKLITWFNFFEDFRLFSPIAILYFAQVSGSFVLGMTIFSIIFITQSVFELPMGIFSDMIGRKKTITIGAVCITFAVIFYAIGETFIVLAIGAILEGLSRTFFSGNNEALLYESLKQANKEKEYADASGKANSMFQLALGMSALAGAGIAIFYGLQILFWISVIPLFVTIILALNIIEPKSHSQKFDNNIYTHITEAWKGFKKSKKLRFLVYSDGLGQGLGEVIHQFRPAFIGLVWPIWSVGIYRTIVHASGFIGFRISGKFIRKFSALKALLLTSTLGNLLQVIALFISNIFSPILMAIPSFFFGIEKTAMTTLQQNEFSHKQRATMGSLSGMVSSITFAIFATGIGYIADIYGVVIALFIGQALLISTIYLNYTLHKM